VEIVDVSVPASPALLGAYPTAGSSAALAIVDSLLLVGADRLVFLDVSDPTSPVELGRFDAEWVKGIQVAGAVAYIASWTNDFQTVTIADPTNPTLLGSASLFGAPYDISYAGYRVYLPYGSNGLKILDVSDPANPVLLADWSPGFDARDVAISGSFGCVASFDDTLFVIDLADPAAPAIQGRIGLGSACRGVTIVGSTAYVAAAYAGLVIVDVSDPAAPAVRGQLDTSGYAYDVAVSGNLAFVADGNDGLRVIDVTDPANPVELGYFDTYDKALRVAVNGGIAYVADGDAGVCILDCTTVPTLLQAFRVRPLADGMEIAWEVASEAGLAAFRIHRARSDAPAGSGRIVAEIPADGSGRYRFVDTDVPAGESVRYRLTAVAKDGTERFLAARVIASPLAAVRLAAIGPNPFRAGTTFEVSVPRPTRTRLAVYDARGRRVAILFAGTLEAGTKRFRWDGRTEGGAPAAAGVYWVRLEADGRVLVRKTVRVR
jgi:hypothetical protein